MCLRQSYMSVMHPWAASTHIHGATTPRQQFAPDELANVMAHYEIGSIDSIQDYPRGSRSSPKAVVSSQQGRFLLKRRAPSRRDVQRVIFSHAIQEHLGQAHFPLARLIRPKDSKLSFLEYQGNIYELFEFIAAHHYPGTLEASEDAGRVLAVYHQILKGFSPPGQPGPGGYHRAQVVFDSITRIESAGQIAQDILTEIRAIYQNAANSAEQGGTGGFPNWPKQIVHADWHPGNLLFREDHVVAVLDYDSARCLAPVTDVANGVLQFSIIDGGENPAHWPDYVDESRFRRFLKGYRGVINISQAETAVLPPLMIEALIAEAVFPIAQTGTFGKASADDFLHMVLRKVRWISSHTPDLIRLAEM